MFYGVAIENRIDWDPISAYRYICMAGKRTIITLTEKDKLWLERYSQLHRISMAQAIRESIGLLKDAESQQTYEALVNKTRGIWRKGDGLRYQRRIRSEWNR
jgi:hypothetical protein